MRKLMWFTVGFGAVCAACGFGGSLSLFSWWISVPVLLGAVLLGILGRKVRALALAALILVGSGTAMLWCRGYDRLYLDALPREQEQQAEIELQDYSRKTRTGYGQKGVVRMGKRSYRVTVYLRDEPEMADLEPGDRISGRFLMSDLTEERQSYGAYSCGRGIFLQARQRGRLVCEPRSGFRLSCLPAMIHHRIENLLERAFPEDTAGFAQALLLGGGGKLDYQEDTAFKISGIRHIVAVSGLHIAILFSLIHFLCLGNRFVVGAVGIPCLIFFAAVTGFTPSVVRACVMEILMLSALMVSSDYDPPTALSFAVLLMLSANPMTISAVGFQMSVGCVAGILLFSHSIHCWMISDQVLGPAKGKSLGRRMKRWIAGSVSVTLGTMVLTVPLSAWHFGTVSLISIVTNLLTLWMVVLIFYGLIGVCILGSIWFPLGQGIAWVISWGIRYVRETALLLSRVPMAAVFTKSIYIVIWLAGVYLLTAVFLLRKKKQPWVLLGCTVAGLLTAVLFSWAEPCMTGVHMTVLDVGQGQSVLIQSEGKTVLVDCGGDSDRHAADEAAEQLLSRGISRLDCLVVTHYDRDHIGGVPYLLSRMDTDLVILPEGQEKDAFLESIAPVCDAPAECPRQEVCWQSGQAEMHIFPSAFHSGGNDSGLCVLFQTENCDILITGDRSRFGEELLLKQTELPQVDILVAGHHGAEDSSCPALLNRVRPEIAVISAGKQNRYGHPAEETLKRLEAYGCRIYRTDRDGTIIFRR